MRTLSEKARGLAALDERERQAISMTGDGVPPREIAERLQMDEAQVFRLVAGVLDETEPPGGPTLAELDARRGSRPATAAEFEELEELYGPSLPPDDEG